MSNPNVHKYTVHWAQVHMDATYADAESFADYFDWLFESGRINRSTEFRYVWESWLVWEKELLGLL